MSVCKEWEELISLYADGALENDAAETVAQHLTECAECSRYFEDMFTLIDTLRHLPEVPLPEGFHESVMASIRAEKKKRPTTISFVRQMSRYVAVFVGVFVIMAAGLAALGPKQLSQPQYEILQSPPMAGNGTLAASPRLSTAEAEAETETGRAEDENVSMKDESQPQAFSSANTYPAPALDTVKTYYATIETENFDHALILARGLGSLNRLESYGTTGSRNVQLTLTTDYAGYDFAVNNMAKLGNVTSENITTTNIAFILEDANARLKAEQDSYDMLMPLMDKAKSVSEMIEIGDRLNYRVSLMDNYQSEATNLSLSASSPTLIINIYERTPVTYYQPTFGQRISDSFTRGYNATVRGAENTLIGLTAALPVLFVLALCGGVLYLILRRFIRRF